MKLSKEQKKKYAARAKKLAPFMTKASACKELGIEREQLLSSLKFHLKLTGEKIKFSSKDGRPVIINVNKMLISRWDKGLKL